jgi:SAM-dependent methyltransferase
MRIRSSRLGMIPSVSALQLIDSCSQDLTPEDVALLKWHQGYLANHRVRIAHDLDIISRQIPKAGRMLELGSIPLVLTAALMRSGYQVIGCDIAPERYAGSIRSAGLDVVKCNIELEKLPFDDGSFDAVIFNELFEHLRINPIFTFSELLRVLKPGGILTLSTPNLKSLDGIGNFLLKDRAYSCSADIYTEYRKLTDIGHMGHVREYTPTEVVEFLQAIGFEVEAIIYRGEYGNRLKRVLSSLIPRLSPFVSYLATKPARSQ